MKQWRKIQHPTALPLPPKQQPYHPTTQHNFKVIMAWKEGGGEFCCGVIGVNGGILGRGDGNNFIQGSSTGHEEEEGSFVSKFTSIPPPPSPGQTPQIKCCMFGWLCLPKREIWFIFSYWLRTFTVFKTH